MNGIFKLAISDLVWEELEDAVYPKRKDEIPKLTSREYKTFKARIREMEKKGRLLVLPSPRGKTDFSTVLSPDMKHCLIVQKTNYSLLEADELSRW